MSRVPGQIDFGQVTKAGLATTVIPGLLTSNQVPCVLVTAVAGEESHSILSCRQGVCGRR